MAVVTGLAIAAAGTAASIGMNLSAAAKQAKAQSSAEQTAADAAKKAESEYQKEFMGGVQLPMEAYQQAGREGTAQQMQSLQALQEADTRSLAAGVGKVQAEATKQEAGIAEQMRQDLFSLEAAQAKEKQGNRDAIARMNEQRAMGAQMAAADAEAARAKAYASIGSSVASLGGQFLQAAPLYAKSGSEGFLVSNDLSKLPNNVNTANQSAISDRFSTPIIDTSITGQPGNTSGFGGVDYSLSSFGIPTQYPNNAFGPQQYPGLTYNK